jgi:hypothetical protein
LSPNLAALFHNSLVFHLFCWRGCSGIALAPTCVMNLAIWLPALLLLGLATMSLMVAFVFGCEKV